LAGVLVAIAQVSPERMAEAEEAFRKVGELSGGKVILQELLTAREDERVVAIYRAEGDLDDRTMECVKEALHHLGSRVRFYRAREA